MSAAEPRWAALSVRESGRVESIREEAWARLDPPRGYERSRPHVTAHPGFTCGPRAAARVAAALHGLVGTEARVEGLSLWPGRERPAVVKLDLDAGGRLRELRGRIESVVKDSGGSVDRDPVPPHITLFKSADAGERPAALLRGGERRLETVEGDYGGWTIGFDGYRVEARR